MFDYLLIAVFSGVALHFVVRFFRFGRVPSLGVALLPVGWILIGFEHLGIAKVDPIAKFLGALAGVALLISVYANDRKEPPK